MPKIDIAKFLERSGVRRTRMGGLVEEDVRAALQALCNEYEQRLARADGEVRRLGQEKAALEQQCRTLAGQNRTLSGQNATLAGSSEKFSRRNQDLDTQLSSLKERNHSLNDQCAVLRLKNTDLARDNAALQDRAQQAETALSLRTEELRKERAAFAANREKIVAEAEAEAHTLLETARKEAAAIGDTAREKAAAIEQAAKTQARQQAQKLVDGAAAEANEIQNAHQLRLNQMQNELNRLTARRDRLIDFLSHWGNELLRSGDAAQAEDPDAVDLPQPPQVPLELTETPAPAAELDFSPDVLAAATAALREQAGEDDARPDPADPLADAAAPEPAPAPAPEPEPEPESEPEPAFEPEPEAETEPEPMPVPEPTPEPEPEPEPVPDTPPRPEEEGDLSAEEIWGLDPLSAVSGDERYYDSEADAPVPPGAVRQTGPALTEVPGAIFSSPIVQRPDNDWEDVPPMPGPRAPVMPDLAAEEDDLPQAVPAQTLAEPAPAPMSPRRRKAVWAVRALRRMRR